MKRTVNKTDLVKAFLKKNGKITQMDAYKYCHYATRLSSIIFELRAHGWPIETNMVAGDSGALYAEYVLVEEKED